MKYTEFRHFLVDIDCLLDIRLALAESIDPVKTVAMMESGLWHARESDRTIREKLGVSREEWLGRYRGQYIELVLKSIGAMFANNIAPYTNEFNDERFPGQRITKKLTINFPHQPLPVKESQDLIEILMERYMGFFEEIHVVHLPHNQCHPAKLSLTYTDYFVYHWSSWLESIYERLSGNEVPAFKVWSFGLKPDSDLSPNEHQEKMLKEFGTFELVTYLHMPVFSLRWIPRAEASYFVDLGEQSRLEIG